MWTLIICFIIFFLLEKGFNGSLCWNYLLAFPIHPALLCNDLQDKTLTKIASGILPLSSFCQWASVRIKLTSKQYTCHKLSHVPCNLSLLQCCTTFSVSSINCAREHKFFVHLLAFTHKIISPALHAWGMLSSASRFSVFSAQTWFWTVNSFLTFQTTTPCLSIPPTLMETRRKKKFLTSEDHNFAAF